mmetsp:Transcript_28792/g.56425  ORF Transcript_28792/g.56425 Transcript_28792/m.56425 type:complete len:243 (+) Transcript_28792:1734-2462(+)
MHPHLPRSVFLIEREVKHHRRVCTPNNCAVNLLQHLPLLLFGPRSSEKNFIRLVSCEVCGDGNEGMVGRRFDYPDVCVVTSLCKDVHIQKHFLPLNRGCLHTRTFFSAVERIRLSLLSAGVVEQALTSGAGQFALSLEHMRNHLFVDGFLNSLKRSHVCIRFLILFLYVGHDLFVLSCVVPHPKKRVRTHHRGVHRIGTSVLPLDLSKQNILHFLRRRRISASGARTRDQKRKSPCRSRSTD